MGTTLERNGIQLNDALSGTVVSSARSAASSARAGDGPKGP